MSNYIISPAAEHDIESILAWTHQQFGESGRLRYEALLVRAILDVADDPQRMGSRRRPEIHSDARTYHLWHSRNRVEAAVGRVLHPRHLLLYRNRDDGRIEIGCILHDSMDFSQHLPEEYKPTNIDDTEKEL
ncbi:MAG: type II toxin-antitoxin system RelE/ParE family toxin [Pirellulales bacterium]|nr:type II toxin-antitoxin system RelE/ParE family toxin [Pirellulales bacterium]